MIYVGEIPENSSAIEVFSFTLDAEPQVICARYLRPLAGTSRDLSVVYNRDNDRSTQFELPWLGRSSIVDNGDGTWTVLLCGGVSQQGGVALWSVEAASEPPSGGQQWGVVGEVDFSALTTTSLVSGVNTVGGFDIYVKGAAFGAGDSAAVVNGSGLRQTRATGSASMSALYGNGSVPDTLLYVPFDQFTGYDPDAPVAVQFRWNDLPTTLPGNIIGAAGMVACEKSAAAVTSAENGSQQSTAWTYFSPGDSLTSRTHYFWKNSGQSDSNRRVASGMAGNAAANAQQATHVYTRAGRVGVCYHDVWSTSFLALEDMSFTNARLYPSVDGAPLAPSFGFFMQLAMSSSYGTYYATMRSMRVLQPLAIPA